MNLEPWAAAQAFPIAIANRTHMHAITDGMIKHVQLPRRVSCYRMLVCYIFFARMVRYRTPFEICITSSCRGYRVMALYKFGSNQTLADARSPAVPSAVKPLMRSRRDETG